MANGTTGNDNFQGLPGEDLFLGLGGDDLINGGVGNDNLNGNQGNDRISSGAGNDAARGGQDNDYIDGEAGNDNIYGDIGNDTALGGDGDDIIQGGNGLNDVSATDNDLLYGNTGNDLIFGNEGNDSIYGGKDNDTVRGGQGNDQLFGQEGDDWLYGDRGADTLTGGTGADRFVLGSGTGGANIADGDLILDFVAGTDILELIGGVTFDILNIFQGTAEFASQTIIQNRTTGEYLARLEGITSTSITGSNFNPPGTSASPSPSPAPAPTPTPTPTTPPSISLEGGTPSPEAGGNITFTLTRSGDTTSALTVPFTLGGTAVAGTNYTAPTTTNFAFNAGATTATVRLPVTNNTIFDPNLAVTLTITPPQGVTLTGANNASVSIINDDLPPLSVVAGMTPSESGPMNGTFVFSRGGDLGTPLTVSYTLAGTATAGTDYTDAGNGTVTFDAGQATATVTLTTTDDAVIDANETVILTATAPTGYTLSGGGTATLTLTDNEMPTIAIAAGTALNETGAVPGTFTLTRTGDTTAALNVSYTLAGTATGTDYTDTTAGMAMFAAGSATATITLTTTDDADLDPNEIVTAAITAPTGYTVTGSPTAQLAITDNELVPLSVVSGMTPTESGPMNGTFVFSRGGDLSAPLSVTYTLAGTATGTDYTDAGGGTVTFAAGQATATVTLTTTDDADIDPNETVILTATAPTGYAFSGGGTATLTITDNDLPTIAIAAGTALNETGAVPGTFTLTRTGDTTAALNVTYTLAGTATGTDYTDPTAGTATFAAGSTTATITLNTTDDADFDPSEIVTATITAPTGYTVTGSATAQLAITDNDLGTISITNGATPIEKVPVIPGAGTPQDGTFILTRTGDVSAALNVTYTITGTAIGGAAVATGIDYNNTTLPATGTATFAAGSASTVITIPTFDDTDIDPSETVIATITAPTGYTLGTATATQTIIDDETPTVTITAGTTPNETGAVAGTFTLTLNYVPTADVIVPYTVSGTAVGGAAAGVGVDYNNTGAQPAGLPASGTVTILAGQTTATLTLPIFDDADIDPSETVIVNINAPAGVVVGGTGSATLTILDDETNTVDVTLPATDGSESGTAGVFTLTRTGNLATTPTVTYTLSGTATSATDYTDALAGSVTFVAGSATATINIAPIDDAAGEGPETVILTLSPAGAGYQLGTTTTGTLNILDNDGTTGDDAITGGATPAVLGGGAGNDNITAGPAGDTLIGGAGNDNLTGGAGVDRFRFNADTEGTDTINAFTPGTDQLLFASGSFGNIAAGTSPVAGTQFISGAGTVAATGAGAPQYIYDSTSGQLRFDADGVAGGEILMATLAGAPVLAATDIVYV